MITGVKCKRNSALTESIEKNRSTKQRLKQAKGITLIALVITIVLNSSYLAMERMNKIEKI